MNITEHLNKDFWKRRVVGDTLPPPPTNPAYYRSPILDLSGDTFRYLTQTDFMREIEPSAHGINSQYQSTRPIKELREVTDEDGNVTKQWQIVGYDDLETTRYGLQLRLALTKAAHFAGDGWGIYNEQTDKSEAAHRRFDNLASWREVAGLDTAFMEITESCFKTGDAAVYIFQEGNTINYHVFSFLKGDILFPGFDDDRREVLYRLYTLENRRAVDVFGPGYMETWVERTGEEDGLLARIRRWLRGRDTDTVISEDGWERVMRKDGQAGKDLNACVYFRIPDIPSGPAQEDICALERSASYVAEGVKATAFETLFIKAANIESLPALGSLGSVIGVKGSVEELKAADAKKLPPSNISDVATIDLKEKKDSILHSTLSVIVDPDVLRSGADSSSAMRLCFNDEVKWCMTMQPLFHAPLVRLTEVLKALVAKIEQDDAYTRIRTSVGINIWVPSNFSESVENVTKLKYAGILSAENARHELDINYPDDMQIVGKEVEEELYRQTFVPLKAKADAKEQFGATEDTVTETVSETVTGQDAAQQTANADPGAAYRPGIDNKATRK